MKAMAGKLHICAGSCAPLLLAYAVSNKIPKLAQMTFEKRIAESFRKINTDKYGILVIGYVML